MLAEMEALTELQELFVFSSCSLNSPQCCGLSSPMGSVSTATCPYIKGQDCPGW